MIIQSAIIPQRKRLHATAELQTCNQVRRVYSCIYFREKSMSKAQNCRKTVPDTNDKRASMIVKVAKPTQASINKIQYVPNEQRDLNTEYSVH